MRILVTGAASGIGRATCIRLARDAKAAGLAARVAAVDVEPLPKLDGLVALTLAWALLHLPAFDRFQIIDTPVYQEYGEAMADGRVPDRDFAVEYPPAALPLFVLPTLAPSEHYGSVFDLLMWACAAFAIVFGLLALAALEASPARLAAAALFMGLAPLALGSVVLSRYDFWPAALVAAAPREACGRA